MNIASHLGIAQMLDLAWLYNFSLCSWLLVTMTTGRLRESKDCFDGESDSSRNIGDRCRNMGWLSWFIHRSDESCVAMCTLNISFKKCIYLKGRARARQNLTPAVSLPKCPQWLVLGQAETRSLKLHPGVSHVGGSGPSSLWTRLSMHIMVP